MWGAATVTNIYVLRWHLQQATADVSQLFAENYQKLRILFISLWGQMMNKMISIVTAYVSENFTLVRVLTET